MSNIESFFKSLNLIISNNQNVEECANNLSDLLSIDLSNQLISNNIFNLQNDLIKTDSISNLVNSENLFDGDFQSFNNLIESYLIFVQNVQPSSILKSNNLILIYFNNIISSIMNNSFGNLIYKLLKNTLNYIFPIIKNLDLILNENIKGKKFKRLIFLSTCLSKLFNHLRSLKGWNFKKSLIIFIVNKLNKIYFIINNPLLCANIFTNMNLLNLNFNNFPKFEQCEYRFILGKFYLIKNKLFKSYYHLNWAYTNLNKNDEINKLKTLRFLVPISLLIGKIPSKLIINQYNELFVYNDLIKHLINGNHLQFQLVLFKNQEYFKNHNLLILLSTKTKTIIFKNLIFNIIKFNSILFPNDPNIYKIHYSLIHSILLKSIGTNQLQDQLFGDQLLYKFIVPTSPDSQKFFIENFCISLIENDLMKGNILSKIQILILSKKNPFPSIFEMYQDKYGIGYDEKWMDL